MPDQNKLQALPVDDLRRELRARHLKPSEALAEFDDATLVTQVKAAQKVIYGTDDRQEIFQLTQAADRDDADSVVALFRSGAVVDNGNGTSTLVTQNFGTEYNLCASERFRDQPTGAFCSGFLVGTDLVATAGHCVNAGNVTTVRFVFGFRMQNATTAVAVVQNSEIYAGASIVGHQLVNNGADWALVRLDRAVTGHRVVRIRRTGRIADTQAVHVIGHPTGLPTKFAGGAAVRDNTPTAFFVANLDTYGGNSGSPVFNTATREVEGILVRGEADFVMQGSCRVSLVCPTTGCRGEDCTRTTEFANLVPGTLPDTIVKKAVDDPPPSIKKLRDDRPGQGIVKKAVDDPPPSFKKLRDDNLGKKVRDDITGKPVLDPIPPLGPIPPINRGLLPFSLATGHHAKHVGGSVSPEAGPTTGEDTVALLGALEQQWLEVEAQLAQLHATSAQALAEAGRLQQTSVALASAYADVLARMHGSSQGETS